MQAHWVKLMPFRGMTGWVCDVHQYPLPDGLEPRTKVTVVARRRDNPSECIVETSDGRLWRVFHWQVDVGTRWNVAGRQWHEKHPDMLDYLQWRYSQLPDDRRRDLGWILERNGRTPRGTSTPSDGSVKTTPLRT